VAKNRARFFAVEAFRGSLRNAFLNQLSDELKEKKIDDLIVKMRSDMLRHGKQYPGTTARVTRGDQPATKSSSTEAQGSGQSRATRAKKKAKGVSSRLQSGNKKGSTTRERRKKKARTGDKTRKRPRGRNVQKL
jgi:hypothetical protein